MSDVVEILRQLVAAPSVSHESNRHVILLAQELLAQAGWSFQQYAYLDEAATEKFNLVAWPKSDPPRDNAFHLAFVCHTDTVPYSQEWTQATSLIADGDNLKGCGACDVKGYLACMLMAALSIDLTRLSKPLAFVLTADEEVGCLGARRLVQDEALRTRFAVIGEPTSLVPVRAGKGYCLAEITVFGREAHSAFPENGRSAIYDGARLITRIEGIAEELKNDRVAGFSPAWTTLNIGEIRGGLAKNIVAPACRFLLEWRPIPGQNPGLVVDLVKQAIAQITVQHPDFRSQVTVLRMQEGFALAQESELLSALVLATGHEAETVPFGTEAPWINKLGAECAVLGPGSMLSAHSPREFVPREELYRCVEILKTVAYDLCR